MIRLDRVWHWGNSTRARRSAASDVFCSFLVSYRTLDIIFALGATGPGVGKKAREHRKDLVQDACAPQVDLHASVWLKSPRRVLSLLDPCWQPT